MPRLLLLLSLLLCLRPAHASAPPPIVNGATSPDGRIFVRITYTLAPPAPAEGRIVSTTYTVLSPIHVVSQRPLAPLTLFGDSWSLTLSRGPYCWPMVSNDGETLLLLHVTPAAPHTPFLDIYRHTGATASLVRTLAGEDLWTTAEINPTGARIFMIKGNVPSWFTFTSLRFTPDGRSLLVRSPQHHALRVNLHDGSVTRLPPPRPPLYSLATPPQTHSRPSTTPALSPQQTRHSTQPTAQQQSRDPEAQPQPAAQPSSHFGPAHQQLHPALSTSAQQASLAQLPTPPRYPRGSTSSRPTP